MFGHIGLFEGHTPALAVDEQEEKRKKSLNIEEEEEDEGFGVNSVNCLDDELPEGFFDDLEEFESIAKYSHFPEALGFPNNNVTLGGLKFFKTCFCRLESHLLYAISGNGYLNFHRFTFYVLCIYILLLK